MPSPPTPRTHRRLTFPRPGRPVPDYVNLYRYGAPDQPGPLLLYVGGAITERQHAERFESAPTPILEQLELALTQSPLPRLDLVIAPSPVDRSDPSAVLDDYEDFFHDELLPALGGPPPTAMAFVGYSFGAHLVTGLALGEESARALATLGGAGIAQAARAAGRVVASGLSVVMFHNTGDALPPPATALGAFDPRLKPWVMPARPGGHGFGSYAANGSVAEAFGFALDLLG
ncbi:MAG: hypothetical protein IPO09_12575 [Anaeromyxobacter sp.]|nr:hypothetical protein [Anaeromyxobacter sp.]MBL0275022.1 hypothetical protein [Anaeromyxobacter sp.]